MGKSAEGRARHSVRAVIGITTAADAQAAFGITTFYHGVQRTARPTKKGYRTPQRFAEVGSLVSAPHFAAWRCSLIFTREKSFQTFSAKYDSRPFPPAIPKS